MAELTPERWREISSLLDRALAVDAEQRETWLREEIEDADLRAEVADLLANAGRSSGVLDQAAGSYLATLLREEEGHAEELEVPTGLRIGPYAIVREAGRGGMGVVYEAERADGHFEHRVALKLIRPGHNGQEIVRRFERERRIMARLEHPSIARILDGGISEDGRPYFAMEFVEGEPLIAYCDRTALSIDDRLGIFKRVCEAVEFAHGHLIVHRDLKPSNILVSDDGALKLVDFGIAKILSDEGESMELTRPEGNRPLTPAYAAPEQLTGEPPTTSADVYALGVVLFQLLAGRLPFVGAGSGSGLEQAILHTEPPLPSRAAMDLDHTAAGGISKKALAGRLSGDLDAVALMALEKDPSRRYASVQALREDIERHQDHLPIRARKQGAWTRGIKFARRHRFGVAATFMVLASLAAGLIATSWQARQKALESDKARQVSAFVVSLFEAADPAQAQGEEITARELVEQGTARLGSELAGQPELQAEMGFILGRIKDKLGLSEEALELLDESLERLPENGGDVTARTRAGALRAKGATLTHLGRAAEAEPVLREAVAAHRKLPRSMDGRDLEIAEDLDELSIALRALGRVEESEAAVLETFDLRLPHLGPDHPRVATSHNNLAVIQREFGKLDAAEASYRRALEIRQAALGADHPETANTQNNLAALLHHRGRYVEARAAFEIVCDTYGRLYGEQHPLTITGSNNLAAVLLKLGEFTRAEELFESVLAYWAEVASDRHPNALMTRGGLALLYQQRGEAKRAESTTTSVVDGLREVLGAEHPVAAIFTLRLASARREIGRYSEAKELILPALALLEEVYGPDNQYVIAGVEELGRIEATLGNRASAEEHLRRAVDSRQAQNGPEAFETLAARTDLAALLRQAGQLDEARQLLNANLATGRRTLPPGHPLLVELLLQLGRVHLDAGSPAETTPLLEEALALANECYGSNSWRSAQVQLAVARLRAKQGRRADSRHLAGAASATLSRELGRDHPLARTAKELALGAAQRSLGRG